MNNRFLITLLLMLSTTTSLADTCPSVQAIKQHAIHGWKLYDIDDNTLLSAQETKQFTHHISQFALAEWPNQSAAKNTIHCYYLDADGSELNAYLAKDRYAPSNQNHYWYEVSGYLHCAAGTDKCLFQTNEFHHEQLAKK